MPGQLFDHIRELYQAELYEDLTQLLSVLFTMVDGNTSREGPEIFTPSQKYMCRVYQGDAYYHMGEYRQAEKAYLYSLVMRKVPCKTRVKSSGSMELFSEVDVQYKVYQCLHKLKQNADALNILEGINTKKRTAKVNLALAKLYLHEERDRSAITCYKEVIREHPLALSALTGLLTLGMRGPDVMAYIMNGLPQVSCDWLNTWIKGHSHMAAKEYSNAVTTFRNIEPACLRDNPLVLGSLGEAFFHGGHYAQASASFRRVHTVDSFSLKNMDLHAYLLSVEKKTADLHALAQNLMAISETAAEPWVAMGYSSLSLHSPNVSKNRNIRAIYCAQKAYSLNNLCVQALVLKGSALFDMKKSPQAIQHFQEAVRMAPNRFEAYQGLINCYLTNRKIKEALSWATKAFKTIGNNARTCTLIASVLAEDSTCIAKAKQYLNRAMLSDPTLLEPVYLMVNILIQEQDYPKGVEILRQSLEHFSTTRLHQLLAECLASMNQHQEALHEYSISLSLDPNNARAREANDRIEKHNELGLDGSYDVEAEEMMNASDGEPDYNSDMESTWSETEFSQP